MANFYGSSVGFGGGGGLNLGDPYTVVFMVQAGGAGVGRDGAASTIGGAGGGGLRTSFTGGSGGGGAGDSVGGPDLIPGDGTTSTDISGKQTKIHATSLAWKA